LKSRGSGYPCFFPTFSGNGFRFLPLILMLPITLLHIAFIMLRYIACVLLSSECLPWKHVEFCQRLLSVQIEMIMWFLSCFCLCAVFNILIYICWTIFVSPEWKQLHHCVWSFECVVELDLQVSYWDFLHLCSLNRLFYNSLFVGSCLGLEWV
jgi:hypothetical protein